MANIYNMVRLLPNSHPYLNPQNIGRFGIRHVIAEAANRLVISKKNIDQIFIFVASLAGTVILLLQILLVLYALISGPVQAQSLFVTPDNQVETDIAMNLLDNVFGVPEIFCNGNTGSAICPAAQNDPAGWPTDFHFALHDILQFYSLGILVVGVIIFLYYILVVVIETAATGSPFGQRFQNVWVPVRLVVALGLLIPLNYGLNSSQYITLYAAKYGSAMATNAWNTYNSAIESQVGPGHNPTGETETLLAKPQPPSIAPVVAFMGLVHACKYAHWHQPSVKHIYDGTTYRDDALALSSRVLPWVVKQPADGSSSQALFLDPSYPLGSSSYHYSKAVQFYDMGDIVIRFGELLPKDDPRSSQYLGRVMPLCGEIRVRIADVSAFEVSDTGNVSYDNSNKSPADAMQKFYYELILELFFARTTDAKKLMELSRRYAAFHLSRRTENGTPLRCIIGCGNNDLPACGGVDAPCSREPPALEARQKIVDHYQGELEIALDSSHNSFDASEIEIDDEVMKKGWAGAGIWYNTISRVNGSFITAVTALPGPSLMPLVMEKVLEEKKENSSSDNTSTDMFSPIMRDGEFAEIQGIPDGKEIATALNSYYKYLTDSPLDMSRQDKTDSGNTFKKIMIQILGIQGLVDITGENASIHPLAQLAAVGKSLIDSAIRNIAYSTGLSFLGGPTGILGPLFGTVAQGASQILSSLAFIGLTAGFILYYLIPFFPFLFFFFAVGQWVKALFEAMVGAPLWALAHLRLDGEGLPGNSAANGYFLIFEIFLRPVIVVFGLIAAITVFAVQVRILNFIWTLVVGNTAGYDADAIVTSMSVSIPRGIVDQFFYTIIYTIICFLLANTAFKLIDAIPEGILRWIGSGATSFGDLNKDSSVEQLPQLAAVGGITLGQNAVRAVSDAGRGLGDILKGGRPRAPREPLE